MLRFGVVVTKSRSATKNTQCDVIIGATAYVAFVSSQAEACKLLSCKLHMSDEIHSVQRQRFPDFQRLLLVSLKVFKVFGEFYRNRSLTE